MGGGDLGPEISHQDFVVGVLEVLHLVLVVGDGEVGLGGLSPAQGLGFPQGYHTGTSCAVLVSEFNRR